MTDHEGNSPDAENRARIIRMGKLLIVADAARLFLQNDKTGGLTGSKLLKDALADLDGEGAES